MKMVNKRPLDTAELDQLFAAAQDDAPQPSDDLMARIMADAHSEMSAQMAPPVAPARQGLFAGLLAMIGGWPAAAGLATATVAGLVIGLSTPDTFEVLAGGYLGDAASYEIDDLMPSIGDLLGEG